MRSPGPRSVPRVSRGSELCEALDRRPGVGACGQQVVDEPQSGGRVVRGVGDQRDGRRWSQGGAIAEPGAQPRALPGRPSGPCRPIARNGAWPTAADLRPAARSCGRRQHRQGPGVPTDSSQLAAATRSPWRRRVRSPRRKGDFRIDRSIVASRSVRQADARSLPVAG